MDFLLIYFVFFYGQMLLFTAFETSLDCMTVSF
ncbi:hypothetical protein A5871_003380 [Enterococcus sp. 2F9_DIV0599]|nr:hypothetical protein A5871_003380 [Enterococcus sp. 2F9_DIV0599]